MSTIQQIYTEESQARAVTCQGLCESDGNCYKANDRGSDRQDITVNWLLGPCVSADRAILYWILS